jgi:GlpG protein
MRLVATLQDKERALQLSHLLDGASIGHQLEVVPNRDWGDDNYGTATCRLWVVDEDQLPAAMQLIGDFQANPEDPRFAPAVAKSPKVGRIEPLQAPHREGRQHVRGLPWNREPLGLITLSLLVICCGLFFFSLFTAPAVYVHGDNGLKSTIIEKLPLPPQYLSPVQKELLYDYPYAFELVDSLIANYGSAALQKPELLPAAGKELLERFEHTSYWQGFYEKIVSSLRTGIGSWAIKAPLFEKISQGQLWRLFTPILLHGDLLHLLFNMIWLLVIGKQLEQRMSKGRYVLFIAVAALLTNTAQYMMSGSNFLGISGVLCAMIAFIWMRQRCYAWEGYILHPSTVNFLAFFLGTMVVIQLASLYMEISWGKALAGYIANTAHMMGLAVGLVMGRMKFFSWAG